MSEKKNLYLDAHRSPMQTQGGRSENKNRPGITNTSSESNCLQAPKKQLAPC